MSNNRGNTRDTSFPYELPNGVVLNQGDEFEDKSSSMVYIVQNVFSDVRPLDKETLKHPQEDGERFIYIGCKTVETDIDPIEHSRRSRDSQRAKIKQDDFVERLNNGELSRFSE